MNGKMLTSVTLLAITLLCFSAAEAQNPEKQESSLIPRRELGYDNVQVFVILRELEARLRDTEEQLEAKLRDTEKELEDLKREMKDGRVAFGAALGNKNYVGPFNTEITLAYNNVFSNTGAFNPATGIFTAPVKGVYYFSFSGHYYSHRNLWLRMMKNENQVATLYNTASSQGIRFMTSTNGMTLQLEEGDHVYIRLVANAWIYDTFDGRSTFNGHLLFRL